LPSTVNTGKLFKVVVQCFDPSTLLAVHYNGPVSLKIISGPGMLLGTTTVNAVGGVATFTGLHVNVAGAYTLRAFVPGTSPLVFVDSTTINAAANRFIITPPTGPVFPGIVFPLKFTALDASGGVATNFTGPITLQITQTPLGGTVNGLTIGHTITPTSVSGGMALFMLKTNKAGTFTLRWTAVAGNLTFRGTITWSFGRRIALSTTSVIVTT